MTRIDGDLPPYSEVCSLCVHLIDGAERRCRAFPGKHGIPVPIWLGRVDHTEPYPGDDGIRFVPRVRSRP